ncbi:glycosyl transferase [Rhodoferax lacus]|uniref:Glycosyl transferase n=1 Tax=Rhodoferax lacus TaxID=2184758 RepID=A0A3E1RF54_9BURK|nr:glycosyltransferase family 2 protein [Rhodoferax lacus]RFO97997.1 glycosyl transferase [Rhodoferax lacus]
MLSLAQTLLTALALALLLPCTVLLVQVLVAFVSRQTNPVPDADTAKVPTRVCILMPAHNEALGLEKILRALLPHLNAHTRLLMVADNCSDNTADLARSIAAGQHPIEVVERQHAEMRGKGYALDFGVRHLEANPPDVVLILDADCEVTGNAIGTLVAQCVAQQRPVQALYLMRNLPGASTKSRLAEFAWLVKNLVRPLGFHRLGLPCQLMGTGMAFTWAHISRASLATGHIVEDMQLGLDLARNNAAPLFCPQALVTSYFPTSHEGIQAQRTRWEHGHLGVIVGQVPALFAQSAMRRNLGLLGMALDLCVPPLALLVLFLVAVCAATGTFWLALGAGLMAMQLAAVALVIVGIAIVLAWLRFGRDTISFRQLCGVPLYIVTKIPLYFFFLVKRQASWVRSKRDGET